MRPRHLHTMERHLSKLTAFCIIAALVFAPLAFGCVEPWAYSILALLAYTALAAVLIRAVAAGRARSLLTPLLIPACLALLLVVVQRIEWPAGLLERVSPRAVELHRDAAASNGSDEGIAAFSPSLYPHATRDALVLLSAYVALFLAAFGHVRSRAEVTKLATAVVSVGFCVSLLGIVQNLSGTRKIFWWRELTHGGALFGPFVSRNQFAAYAGVCLFVGIGLLLARGARAAGSLRNWRDGITRKAAARTHQSFLLGFAVALTAAAVVWSLSRGGILSMLLAFAGVLVALGAASVGRRKGLYVAAVIVVALGWVSYLGWEPVVRRLSTLEDVARDPRATWRWQMVGDAWRMGLDFPMLGTGAGTFLSVYPHYRTLPTRAVTDSPHDEYAQVLAEAGVTGLVVLVLAAVMLYATLIRGLIIRKDPYVRGLLAGGLGAPLAVTLHSVVDFPMRSPAIAATLAVVAAVLCRTARMESNGRRRSRRAAVGVASEQDRAAEVHARTGDRPAEAHARTGGVYLGLVAFVCIGVAWVFACDFALNPLRGQLESRFIRRIRESVGMNGATTLALVEASERNLRQHSPGDAALHAELADLALAGAVTAADPMQRLQLADKSLKLRAVAARLEPMNAEHPYRMALHYLSFQRADLAWAQAERACELLPNDPWVRAYLADAFRAYGQPEMAADYLQQADDLADERGIEPAKPSIADVRKRLEEEPATGQ